MTVARSIYKTGGIAALDWIFSLIEGAHWEDFKESYSADILMGLSSVYLKHINNLSAAWKNLLEFMKKINPTEVIGIANTEYPTQGHQTRVRLILEEIAGNDGKNKKIQIKLQE